MGGRAPRRHFLRHVALASAGLFVPGRPARAQERDSPLFRLDAELITTPVTVNDTEGRLVATLDREDFLLFEDGILQPLAQFTRERVPVSVALVLDGSDSMRGSRMGEAHAALSIFVMELLSPLDEAALVTFNHQPRVAVGWSREREALRDRLVSVKPSGGTALYDAVASTLPLFRARRHARAAMVLVSDGADTASDLSLSELRRMLTGSEVFVYAIALESGGRGGTLQVNPWALRDLTGRGGGYTEVISSPSDLGPATSRIADELNHQYLLGFSPDRKADGRFHTIRVAVRGAEHRVRSRRGYLATRLTR
jgi:VWFA-related protein